MPDGAADPTSSREWVWLEEVDGDRGAGDDLGGAADVSRRRHLGLAPGGGA